MPDSVLGQKSRPSPHRRNTLTWTRERERERREPTKKKHRRCDWINLSICQLHGWVCLVAACLSPFIDRNRIGGRLPLMHDVLHACAWNRDVRRATHVRASRLYVRMCTPARTLARYNRVHRLGAQIQRAELVHRTVEEAEDRIDSPVTETRHAQREVCTTSLTSCLERESSVNLCETRCAKNKAFITVPIMCRRYVCVWK